MVEGTGLENQRTERFRGFESHPHRQVSTSDSRWVMGFVSLGHTCTHMFTILYATAVLHLPSVFGLPYGELLALSSLGLILFGVGALPAGWLGDRWSQVGMMVIFFVGLGAGAVFTGLAQGPDGVFMGLTLIGLFASIYHPVGLAWLVASARKQGMALGINGVFGSVGSSLAPVFVGLMIDFGSWRAAFVGPGIVAIVIGLGLAWSWHQGWVGDIKSDVSPPPAPEAGTLKRVFIVLTLTMACSGFVYIGMINTMPKLFETGLGPVLAGSYTEIGLFVGAILGLSSIGSVLGGMLADRYSARSIYIVFWLALVIPLFSVTSLLGVGLLAVAALAVFLNVCFGAAENMLVARYTPFEWRSLAYGAKFVLALGVGGVTVHVAGNIYDATGGFHLLYVLFGGCAIVAGGCALLLPRGGPGWVVERPV